MNKELVVYLVEKITDKIDIYVESNKADLVSLNEALHLFDDLSKIIKQSTKDVKRYII